MVQFRRILHVVSLSTVLVAPTVAQFGVAGNKRQENTKFQELQELAQKQAQGGDAAAAGGAKGLGGLDVESLQKLWGDAMNDPEAMANMQQYGDMFSGALEKMMQMSPDELQQQLSDAMKLMTDGDIVDTVLQQRESVLQTLESTGTVSKEELERYRTDPAYFELKMRESFGQMKDIFSNPEYISKAADAMKNMKGLIEDPEKLADLTKSLGGGDWTSDEKLEEARLQFLSGQLSGIPGLDEIFKSDEMQEILKDPVKWKETVKDGLEDLLNLGGGAGNPTGVPTTPSINDEL